MQRTSLNETVTIILILGTQGKLKSIKTGNWYPVN